MKRLFITVKEDGGETYMDVNGEGTMFVTAYNKGLHVYDKDFKWSPSRIMDLSLMHKLSAEWRLYMCHKHTTRFRWFIIRLCFMVGLLKSKKRLHYMLWNGHDPLEDVSDKLTIPYRYKKPFDQVSRSIRQWFRDRFSVYFRYNKKTRYGLKVGSHMLLQDAVIFRYIRKGEFKIKKYKSSMQIGWLHIGWSKIDWEWVCDMWLPLLTVNKVAKAMAEQEVHQHLVVN